MKRLYLFVLLLLSTAILKAQDTIRLFSFASDDMVGITYGATGALTASDIIAGDTADAHGHTAPQSYWQRIADSATHFNTYSTTYPGLSSLLNASYIWSNVRPPYIYADDGFMLASMYDVTFSRDQPFNVFLGFPAVAIPASTQLVEVAWQQAYAKYYDQCFVDYKVNGQWQTMEVNVTGIDVQVNSSGPSYVRYTLPATAAQESNLELRLRYYNSAQRGNAYGYGWAVDNFAVISGNPDQWQVQPEHFVDGKYNQIPQGMQIPLTWYNNVRNTGINTQTGVNVAMQHTAPSGATSTFLSQSMGNLAPSSTADTLVIDPRGFYDATYPGWFEYAPNYGLPSISPIGNNGLPTANAGLNTVQTTLSSNALNYQYDPHSYTVTTADADGAYAWGYANGVLAGGMDGFRRGYTYDGYLTNAANTTYNESGYQVRSRITTGNTLPVDNNGEPWVIRGVEMVVSPTCSTAAGTRLTPILYKMIITPHYHSTADEVATGVAEYTVTADDYTLLDTGYLLPGQYNTLRIMFPTQPVLEPNTQYYIGYRLEGDYDFSLAQNSTRFKTTGSDGTIVNRYFHQVPGMEAYHHSFKPDNYDVMVQTYRPTYDSYWWLYSGNHFDDEAPMISALVGPAVAMPTNTVTVISAHAHVWHDLRNSYPGECDTCIVIDTLPAGSDIHYTFSPKEGYRITDITLDGVSILADCGHATTSYAADYGNYVFWNDRYTYQLSVGTTPHTIVVSTEPRPERFVTINCPASGVFVTDNLHGTDQCGTHGTYAVQMEYLFTATDGWAIDTLFIDGDTIYPYDGSRVVYTLNINDSDHIINIVAHSQSTYCEPNPTSRDGLGITGVAFGGMTNTADRASTAPFYTDFTALSGSVLPGDTVQVYITYVTGYTYGTIIWVDWNQNLIFEDNEVVYTGESTNAFPTTLSATFAVPSTQATGNYRMRIAGADYFFDSYVNNGTGSPDPCATYPWGVAEDYTLTVTNDLHTHTLTFINEGGGAFSARIFGSARSDLSIHNAMQVSVPADSSCHVLIRMTSLDPLNDYYFLDSAHARLTHFYVDGVEIPLDSITHYNSTSHAYYHSYGINNIDADHTFRAVFEPWGDTVFPPTHTVSIIKEGDGYIIPSTGQYTIYEGSSVDIEMSSLNAQLTHFYVDGGEIPLDSISVGYDSELDFYYYTYTLSNITADHTVRAVFGPWDSVPTPPTHTITFINEGGGHFDFDRPGDSHYEIYDSMQLTVAGGSGGYIGLASFEPTSPYFGLYCDSTNARLLHFYVDGVEIPLDSLSYSYDTEGLYYYYQYFLSNINADHTIRAVFGPWDSVPTPPTPQTYTLTLINEGGGSFSIGDDYNYWADIIDTLQITVQADDYYHLDMFSFFPTNPYYGSYCDSTNAQLTHFYVDGVEIPLDSIFEYYDTEDLYYWYVYNLYNITADHTIRAVFGPWDSVPTPQTHTLTLINEGGGAYNVWNGNGYYQNITDTVQITVAEGSYYYVGMASIEPTSPLFGQICDATNAQLLHFYVDGVEVPLDSILDSYDSEGLYYWYEYILSDINADHTIRAVFGPWDSVPTPQTYTLTLINEGGGFFMFDNYSYGYDIYDSMQLTVAGGSGGYIYLVSFEPTSPNFGIECDSTNARLLHFYVDGVEIPLDSIFDNYDAQHHNYWYEYLFTNITADHTVRAVFGPWEADIVYYTVSLAAGDSTMGSVSGGGTFAEGDTATLTATANAGFHFVAWSDGVTDNPRQLVVTADTALAALFEADSTQGIGNVEKMTFSAVAIDGRIHVRLDNEQDEFRVYDISGRELSRQRGSGETPAMPTGVYLVKVGILPAQKVMVVR